MNEQQYKELLFKIIENERALGETIINGDIGKKIDLIMQYKVIRAEACKVLQYN